MDFELYKNLFGVRKFTSNKQLRTGNVIQFTYDNEQKFALVLNPNWQGKLHALSLKTLTPDSLKSILNELVDESSYDIIYEKYKNSTYVDSRSYRTYTVSKIKTLREIFLKEDNK